MVGFAILIIIIFFVIYVRNQDNRERGEKLLKVIEEDENNKNSIADNLEFCIASKPINNDKEFMEIFSSFQENKKLGQYTILKQVNIDEYSHLFITLCTFNDYTGINFLKNVKKENQYSFLFKKNIEKNTYQIYSTPYNDLQEKNLQNDFAFEVFKLL